MTIEQQQTNYQRQLQTLEEFKGMGIQINLEDALLTAIQANKPYNVQKLLALGANPNKSVKESRPFGKESSLEKKLSLASYAAFHNKVQVLQLLIKYGAHLSKMLQIAIEANHTAAVRILTDQPIEKTKLLPSGDTWITLAIRHKAFSALEVLLEKGYDAQQPSEIQDISKKKFFLQPYQYAIRHTYWPAFLILLKKGVPFPKDWSNYETSSLLFDAETLDNEELHFLLELNKKFKWADVNALNNKGETIAFESAYMRRIKQLRLMADYGVDLSIKNKYNVTVFERVYEGPFGEVFSDDLTLLEQLKKETYPDLKEKALKSSSQQTELEPDPFAAEEAPKKRKPRKDPDKKGPPRLSYAKKVANLKNNLLLMYPREEEERKPNLIRERKERPSVRPVSRQTRNIPRMRSGGRGM